MTKRKSRILHVQTLIDKGACLSQVKLVRKTFGESVRVTVALCARMATQFQWEWAATHLLSADMLADYKAAIAKPSADYEAARAKPWADCAAAIAKSSAAYEAARAKPWADCAAAIAQSWADYKAAIAQSWADYKAAIAKSWADYAAAMAKAFARAYLADGGK
jgi:hypothetical protein